MSLLLLGSVNSEGGPVLILDAALVSSWSGIEGSDYARACEPFDRDPSLEVAEVAVEGGRAVAWDMGGAGTADVFRTEAGLLLARYWLTNPQSEEERRTLVSLPVKPNTATSRFRIHSGRVCVVWAATGGEDLGAPEPSDRGASANSDRTALVFDLEPGDYEYRVDAASAGSGTVRRCLFSRAGSVVAMP